MSNITTIPAARVPVLDPLTGCMSPVWYRFFQNIYTTTRDLDNPTLALETYADNAAAIAGGLVAGQLYQVDTGVDPQPLYIVH
jgi:hypothetical protein